MTTEQLMAILSLRVYTRGILLVNRPTVPDGWVEVIDPNESDPANNPTESGGAMTK